MNCEVLELGEPIELEVRALACDYRVTSALHKVQIFF